MKVKLIAKSSIVDPEVVAALGNQANPEQLIMYCARVSSNDQTSGNSKLLKYCLDHGHVSVFETASYTFEIETSRAIAAQILRHKSFNFQEFSQRYQTIQGTYEEALPRRQDSKNRQNSIDDMSEETHEFFKNAQAEVWNVANDYYNKALELGIAKEQARMLLPLNTQTKLYMTGSVRSWIHYLQVRTDPATQKEHRDIAEAIRAVLKVELPNIAEALGWNKV
jgi:thymidylate synthase (FAD)